MTLKHYQKVLDASLVAGVTSWDSELIGKKKQPEVTAADKTKIKQKGKKPIDQS